MFTRCALATITTMAHPAVCSDLVLENFLVVTVTCMIVVVARVIVIVAGARILNMLVVAMDVRITRASMMQTAPENRVQQDRCDGEKLERGVHVEKPYMYVIWLLSNIWALW